MKMFIDIVKVSNFKQQRKHNYTQSHTQIYFIYLFIYCYGPSWEL